MSDGKEKLVSSFINNFPENASISLRKCPTNSLNVIIEKYDPSVMGKALNYLSPQIVAESLLAVDEAIVARLSENMQPNLVSRIFRSWMQLGHRKRVESILSSLDPKLAKSMNKLAKYSDTSVGSVMNPTPFTVSPNNTTKEVLSLLNKNKSRYSRYVYVVSDNHVLVGVIPFKDAFYSERASLVSKVMATNVFSFRPEQTIKDALKNPHWSHWDSIPVTDSKGIIQGVVSFDSLKDHNSPDFGEAENEELMNASRAVGEVFQIGLNGAVAALGLMGAKK